MAKSKELTFEQAYQGLEKCVENISDNKSLEDTIKSYEEGIEYYNTCKEILEKANQKIEVVSEKE